MNSCNFIGRLVNTPKLEVLDNEEKTKVSNFTIAVYSDGRVKGSGESAYFYDCKAWGKQAEFLVENFVQGEHIGVSGKLRYDEYQTKEKKKYRKYYIYVRQLSFCENKHTGKEEEEEKEGE